MLYSEALLDAAKLAQLVDDDTEELSDFEVKKYFDYLKYAIAKFNNNPKVSIGTEKFICTDWKADTMGPFVRIVRDPDLSHLFAISGTQESNPPVGDFPGVQDGTTLSTLQNNKEREIKRRPWEFVEIPQRIISAGEIRGTSLWNIVNLRDFFSSSQNDRVVCYEILSENEAIIRARFAHPLFILFDRAIPYSFGLIDLIASVGNFQGSYKLWDLIKIYVDLPTTHIPFFITMAAVELANGQKQDADVIQQLKDQCNSQEKDLLEQNVRDRVKTDHILRDDSWNFWHRRAFR